MDVTKQEGTGSWLHGISAITLFVEDLETTKAFYQRVFGLPVAFEDENSAVFEFGGTMVNRFRQVTSTAVGCWGD